MYQFKIRKQEDGGYRFDLGSIKMLVEDYTIKDDKHLLINPSKAIAYFNTKDNIYSISNDQQNFETAEAFYEAISKQFMIFCENNAAGSMGRTTAFNQLKVRNTGYGVMRQSA